MSVFVATLTLSFALGAPLDVGPHGDLVRKLGDRSFRARDRAAFELLKIGVAALPALKEGINDPDPEVSERCRQLLPQAENQEREHNLSVLLKDLSVPPSKALPGVEKFLKITGDTKASRELYAEFVRIHHRPMSLLEKNEKAAVEAFQEFVQDAYNRYMVMARTGRVRQDTYSRADIVYFLVFASDTRIHRQGANNGNYYTFTYNNDLQNSLTNGDYAPAMRKLFLEWIEKEPQAYMQQRGFQIAAQVKMPEALPLALKMLEKKDGGGYATGQVLPMIAQLGKKENIKTVWKFMNDSTNIGSVNFGDGQMSVELRDVAMGVCIQLAGQKMTDFGFDNRFGGAPTSYYYFGFRDDESRTTAHKKWKEWATKNLKPEDMVEGPAVGKKEAPGATPPKVAAPQKAAEPKKDEQKKAPEGKKVEPKKEPEAKKPEKK